ncbi:exonuclease SbcCD subunit D [Paenibacillus antri]|uniref:Nuclease SbcCD subunit D n=1 Tax=Paenibacillus antri TaxID=2582848 RepID=A0A5R9GCC7_9BACL|nr:exonuclease SbcCD subunit D [Paenibacillus antri]TLS50333.1 exonuclease SbcCD subunit D [Paenibacillus antri]
MRLLHTADWHFGRTLEGRSRQAEHEAFVDELARIADEADVDAVLLAGDVYDSVNPPADAETLFYEALTRLSNGGRRPVVAIAGNHDHPDRLSAAGPLARAQGVTLVGLPTLNVVTLPIARTGERANVYALPYPSESRLKELLSVEADEQALQLAYSARIAALVRDATGTIFGKGNVDVVMSHLHALGGSPTDSERPIEVGGAYTVDPSAFGRAAQYVALGHLHRPQNVRVRDDGENGAAGAAPLVRYSGSPLAFSFSEAGQAKSVSIVDIAPGGAPRVEEVPLSAGRPLVRWIAKEGLADVHRWFDEGKDARAWVDLELHVTDALTMEQIQTLRRSHEGLVLIRPVFASAQESIRVRAERALPIDELFRRFYARQTGGATPDEATVRLFLELVREEAEEESA